jgi:hypothetical protein
MAARRAMHLNKDSACLSCVWLAAVKKNPPTSSATKEDIKDAVMTWLNGSRDRGKDGRQNRYIAASLKRAARREQSAFSTDNSD